MNEGTATMFGLIASLPEQLRAAPRLPGSDLAGLEPGTVRDVLVCGMGGSAIAADLLAPLVRGGRLSVWRDYGLPAWVDAATLVILSSYSGDTEETLSAAAAAADRGCRVLRITSGGTLAGLAPGSPRIELPGGLPPRASLGFGLGALAAALDRLGLLPDGEAGLREAADLLESRNAQRGPDAPAVGHPVRGVAAMLAGRTAVIHTTSPETHAVGRRWRGQIQENGKQAALCSEYPELDHNEIEGWREGGEDGRALIVIRGADEHPRTSRRVEVTTSLLAGVLPAALEIRPAGTSPLARILDLVQYGDYLSVFLAMETGVDPVPVARIQELKHRLA